MPDCCHTEETYDRLTRICDRILRRPDAPLTLMALPWLHIINEVPFVLTGYADLIDALEPDSDSRHRPSFIQAPIRRGRWGAYRFALLMRNLIRPMRNPHAGDPETALPALKNGGVDVIIVSWLINDSHLAEDDDFYFGNLQALLAERGFSSLLVLRNQSGHPTRPLLKKTVRSRPFSRVMLPETATLAREIHFIKRCLSTRRYLRQYAVHASCGSERRLCGAASRLAVSNPVVQNLRLHAQMEALCRNTRPSVVITLYEGHAWERCVYHAARRAGPLSRCVGYQHTAIRKRSHALKRSLSPHHDFDPDLVLTVGTVTRRILEKSHAVNGVQTLLYGTHRRTGGDASVHSPRRETVFLVLPEGDGLECIYLFEFALECAHRLPEVRFIFRTHPYFPIERLAATQKWRIPTDQNVEISRYSKIEDDFDRAGYLIYRGSSTVIYAILYGLKPFYLARPDELNFDPLFELSVWRQNVYSVDDLVDHYRMDRSAAEDIRLQEWKQARRYCDHYVQPIQQEAVTKIMARSQNARS